jgi:hypothetical protein
MVAAKAYKECLVADDHSTKDFVKMMHLHAALYDSYNDDSQLKLPLRLLSM